MGGGEYNTREDDRADILAAALVDAVRDDGDDTKDTGKPSFAPLYDRVYGALRRSDDRRAYAQSLWQNVAARLVEVAPDKGPTQSRLARMLADLLAPVRHTLDLCPEAFATLLLAPTRSSPS